MHMQLLTEYDVTNISGTQPQKNMITMGKVDTSDMMITSGQIVKYQYCHKVPKSVEVSHSLLDIFWDARKESTSNEHAIWLITFILRETHIYRTKWAPFKSWINTKTLVFAAIRNTFLL